MAFAGFRKFAGEVLLESNKAVNGAFEWGALRSGIKNAADRRIMESPGIKQALRIEEGKDPGNLKRLRSMFYNRQGDLSYKRIAGGYIGVSAAGRIASGGGVYRNQYGDFDVAGVPLI